jgi:hypothetical protein
MVFSSPAVLLCFGSVSYLFFSEHHWNLLCMGRDNEGYFCIFYYALLGYFDLEVQDSGNQHSFTLT